MNVIFIWNIIDHGDHLDGWPNEYTVTQAPNSDPAVIERREGRRTTTGDFLPRGRASGFSRETELAGHMQNVERSTVSSWLP